MAGTVTVLTPTSVVIGPEIPGAFKLDQNYPNPFNPATEIKYSIPKTVNVKLTVYDLNGNLIKVLVNRAETGGNYTVKFNADNYSSGIYLYKLRAGVFTDVKKMILLK